MRLLEEDIGIPYLVKCAGEELVGQVAWLILLGAMKTLAALSILTTRPITGSTLIETLPHFLAL